MNKYKVLEFRLSLYDESALCLNNIIIIKDINREFKNYYIKIIT